MAPSFLYFLFKKYIFFTICILYSLDLVDFVSCSLFTTPLIHHYLHIDCNCTTVHPCYFWLFFYFLRILYGQLLLITSALWVSTTRSSTSFCPRRLAGGEGRNELVYSNFKERRKKCLKIFLLRSPLLPLVSGITYLHWDSYDKQNATEVHEISYYTNESHQLKTIATEEIASLCFFCFLFFTFSFILC